jgi:type VI secretion system protein ImpM
MEVGLYGKLPSHGDFLRRRVSDAFVTVWDEWLQQSIAASRSALGQNWLDVYLTSPVWRFACDTGVCGPKAIAGLMAPSVDRVGRYFPLTLVWEVPQGVHPLAVTLRADRWLDQVERLLLDALAEEHVDLEKFDQGLIALGRELDQIQWASPVELDALDAVGPTSGARAQWQLSLGTPPALGIVLEQLLYARLKETHGPLTVMWTDGSARVEPSGLLLSGLPAPSTYAALLSGEWCESGWRIVKSKSLAVPPPSSRNDTWTSERPIAYRSSGATDVGRVRRTNQDAFIERTEIGVWAVADGMGGHEHGEIASRMICDALAAFVPGETLRATADAITQQLGRINEYLYRTMESGATPGQTGSTVVAFVTRGTRCAVLWAGDSRIYRLRGGELLQLTRDHVADSSGGADERNAISRAVGGDATLEVDAAYHSVHPGDRFLLCSDGLNHEIGDDVIAQKLREPDLTQCVQGLIAAALWAGGTDNVSVIVVDAFEPA